MGNLGDGACRSHPGNIRGPWDFRIQSHLTAADLAVIRGLVSVPFDDGDELVDFDQYCSDLLDAILRFDVDDEIRVLGFDISAADSISNVPDEVGTEGPIVPAE